MIINGETLLKAAPIKNMLTSKHREYGVTHGLGEAGYDIRIAQSIHFTQTQGTRQVVVHLKNEEPEFNEGRFALASATEEFDMPDFLVGVVHDKSTWARRGLSVFNTVIESGWKGFLTLELVYHGNEDLIIPAGAGIAQVLFHTLTDPSSYVGRYQNQENKPVHAREA